MNKQNLNKILDKLKIFNDKIQQLQERFNIEFYNNYGFRYGILVKDGTRDAILQIETITINLKDLDFDKCNKETLLKAHEIKNIIYYELKEVSPFEVLILRFTRDLWVENDNDTKILGQDVIFTSMIYKDTKEVYEDVFDSEKINTNIRFEVNPLYNVLFIYTYEPTSILPKEDRLYIKEIRDYIRDYLSA